MELIANIKDDGTLVRVTSIDDRGDRQTYKVSINDFISSMTAGTANEMLFFPRNGKVPKTLYDFQMARNASAFSCHAIFVFPAGKYLIDYCGENFYAALPDIVFDFYVKNEELAKDRSMVYAGKEGILYRYPLSNVYEGGRICWGSLKLPKIKNFGDLEKVCELFLQARGNSDLSGYIANTRYKSMGQFLKKLDTLDEYPDDAYWDLSPYKCKLDDLLETN